MVKHRAIKVTKLLPTQFKSKQTKKPKESVICSRRNNHYKAKKSILYREVSREQKLLAEHKLHTRNIYCHEYSCHLYSICKSALRLVAL